MDTRQDGSEKEPHGQCNNVATSEYFENVLLPRLSPSARRYYDSSTLMPPICQQVPSYAVHSACFLSLQTAIASELQVKVVRFVQSAKKAVRLTKYLEIRMKGKRNFAALAVTTIADFICLTFAYLLYFGYTSAADTEHTMNYVNVVTMSGASSSITRSVMLISSGYSVEAWSSYRTVYWVIFKSIYEIAVGVVEAAENHMGHSLDRQVFSRGLIRLDRLG
ncbi:uncharacterized protein F5147DRAFT_656105 [Suillus discolor]|uniref:Uncharacterized protein n=1 Tax=Suillus discolor TaxID=1912936 RepID=A0A9P7EZ27_9AGAM|nr:uncharacterized protein F5147DRAFT_656105 [Suillus discolor]KAG2098213.1 hypothetical protein F5147DRAFT_656105 [Suillus discolor]